jgi:hypothetical protein
MLLLVALLSVSLISATYGEDAPVVDTPVAAKETTPAAPKKPGFHLELGMQMSLNNTYDIGNLDTWFRERTGNHLSENAPGFNQYDVRFMGGNVGDPSRIGLGVNFYQGSTHALNGSSVLTTTQFAADPKIIMLSMPIQIQFSPGSSGYLTFEPAMGVAMLEGYFSTGGSSRTELTPTPRVGYQLGIGLDYYMGGLQILSRLGYRLQQADLTFTNAAGEMKQYTLNNGEEVTADLSGMYMTIGLGVRL